MIPKETGSPYESESSTDDEVPLLPEEELLTFVKHHYGNKKKYLKIIREKQSPLYILESSVLKKRAFQFQNAFKKHLDETSFYFAVKSNNHPDVAKTVLGSGFGLDVSSGLELETALSLGADNIIFSGPGKTDLELSLAVDNSEYVTVLIDSFGELHRIEKIASDRNVAVRSGVRLSPDPSGLWRKFGIALGSLPAFWEEANRCPHVHLTGLQFHTSWNLSPRAQVSFIAKLGDFLEEMPKKFTDCIDFIDIGGGYWPEQGEWLQADGTPAGVFRKAIGKPTGPSGLHFRQPGASINEFADQLCTAIKRHLYKIIPCRICFEPGRWICNDAMHLFISVVDIKERDIVITDAGTNSIGWERFETDYCPILNLTRPSLDEKLCNVLGSLCTPHDIWGYTYWGADIQPGDILMIPTQGAYTYSLRQNFIKPLPSVVTI